MKYKTYGKQEKGVHPSEAAEMSTFFNQLRKHYPQYAAIALHIRNEHDGDHNKTSKSKLQGGFIKGASDIVIIGNPTFVCEMKAINKGSRLSKEQIDFLNSSAENGAFACVAYGWQATMQAFREWIKEAPQ